MQLCYRSSGTFCKVARAAGRCFEIAAALPASRETQNPAILARVAASSMGLHLFMHIPLRSTVRSESNFRAVCALRSPPERFPLYIRCATKKSRSPHQVRVALAGPQLCNSRGWYGVGLRLHRACRRDVRRSAAGWREEQGMYLRHGTIDPQRVPISAPVRAYISCTWWDWVASTALFLPISVLQARSQCASWFVRHHCCSAGFDSGNRSDAAASRLRAIAVVIGHAAWTAGSAGQAC